jgi:predicted transcriptional regulator
VKIVTVKLPEALDERLSKAAQSAGIPKSSVVRDALAAYLGEQPKDAGGEPSVFDLAAGSIGAVRGPGLSAIDPHRMKGYGG